MWIRKRQIFVPALTEKGNRQNFKSKDLLKKTRQI